MSMSMKLIKCCICGKNFVGYGNNPYPVKTTGKCCNLCDNTVVLVARIQQIMQDRSVDKR